MGGDRRVSNREGRGKEMEGEGKWWRDFWY